MCSRRGFRTRRPSPCPRCAGNPGRRPDLTRGGLRSEAAPALRSGAGRGRPHPQTSSPPARADKGGRLGSGTRASRPGAPGPPLPPAPSPMATADRGRCPLESDCEAAAPRQPGGPGEGLALPRFMCSPAPAAAGAGVGGEDGPGGPGRETRVPLPDGYLPLSASPWERGLGGEGGPGEPRPRGAGAASQPPPLVSGRGRRGNT